jgi:hypothetical protein
MHATYRTFSNPQAALALVRQLHPDQLLALLPWNRGVLVRYRETGPEQNYWYRSPAGEKEEAGPPGNGAAPAEDRDPDPPPPPTGPPFEYIGVVGKDPEELRNAVMRGVMKGWRLLGPPVPPQNGGHHYWLQAMTRETAPPPGGFAAARGSGGTERNELVAAARAYPADVQVLVMVDTIEHALHLRQLLPDFAVVYGKMKPEDLRYIRNQGLLAADEEPLSHRDRLGLQLAFEAGRLNKAVATGVWSTGVNFVHLRGLVRADAGASPIPSVQLPGRVSRIAGGKDEGRVDDFLDQFDEGFRRKAQARRRVYEREGWAQVFRQAPGARRTSSCPT